MFETRQFPCLFFGLLPKRNINWESTIFKATHKDMRSYNAVVLSGLPDTIAVVEIRQFSAVLLTPFHFESKIETYFPAASRMLIQELSKNIFSRKLGNCDSERTNSPMPIISSAKGRLGTLRRLCLNFILSKIDTFHSQLEVGS